MRLVGAAIGGVVVAVAEKVHAASIRPGSDASEGCWSM